MEVDPPPWRSGVGVRRLRAAGRARVHRRLGAHPLSRSRAKRVQRESWRSSVRDRTRELATHAQALEAANRRLEEASFTDPLTGLGNRRSLKHIDAADISRHAAAAASLGADGGRSGLPEAHQRRVRSRRRRPRPRAREPHPARTACTARTPSVRWGGDEFVIVHACDDLEAAAELAERMRIAVATASLSPRPDRHRAHELLARLRACIPFVRAAPGPAHVGRSDATRGCRAVSREDAGATPGSAGAAAQGRAAISPHGSSLTLSLPSTTASFAPARPK